MPGKADARDAVHLERHDQAVPVDGGVLVEHVSDDQLDVLALAQPDERRGDGAVDGDGVAGAAVHLELTSGRPAAGFPCPSGSTSPWSRGRAFRSAPRPETGSRRRYRPRQPRPRAAGSAEKLAGSRGGTLRVDNRCGLVASMDTMRGDRSGQRQGGRGDHHGDRRQQVVHCIVLQEREFDSDFQEGHGAVAARVRDGCPTTPGGPRRPYRAAGRRCDRRGPEPATSRRRRPKSSSPRQASLHRQAMPRRRNDHPPIMRRWHAGSLCPQRLPSRAARRTAPAQRTGK